MVSSALAGRLEARRGPHPHAPQQGRPFLPESHLSALEKVSRRFFQGTLNSKTPSHPIHLSCSIGVRISLVIQWLGIRPPMQGTWVQSLVWEDSTCHGATEPAHRNYWSQRAPEPTSSSRLQWEAHHCNSHHNQRKPTSSRGLQWGEQRPMPCIHSSVCAYIICHIWIHLTLTFHLASYFNIVFLDLLHV